MAANRSRVQLQIGALLGLLACQPERPALVRVGDAVPRPRKDSTLIDVVAPLLEGTASPRVEIARWTVASTEIGVGEVDQARRFIDDGSVVAVVGHAGSNATLLVAPIYRDAGMPLIVPTATARALRDAGAGVFMLAPPDDVIGAFLVDQARDRLGARRIGILHIADPYGDGIRDGMLQRLRARGDSLVGAAALSGLECDGDGLALNAVVRAFVQRSHPDAVVVALPLRPATCAIRQLAALQPGLKILASDSFVHSEQAPVLTLAERASVYSLVFWEPGTDSVSQAFVARARTVLGLDPEPAFALAFDAMRLVATAAREGHGTRRGVTEWLNQLGTPGHPPFQGITGPIDFQKPRVSVLHLKALGDSARHR